MESGDKSRDYDDNDNNNEDNDDKDNDASDHDGNNDIDVELEALFGRRMTSDSFLSSAINMIRNCKSGANLATKTNISGLPCE